jgi:chromosome partitioning protein
LVLRQPLAESECASTTPGLKLLPGSRRFQDTVALGDVAQAVAIREHLSAEVSGFDFVLIDCPPSLGQLTRTALGASSEVLMPIQCEYFAMEGLTQMIEVIRTVMRSSDRCVEFAGILLTMYDHTLELTAEVDEEVREFFGDVVFQTVIPRDVAVSEAPSHGCSVLDHAPRSRGARAYTQLCMEVLNRD